MRLHPRTLNNLLYIQSAYRGFTITREKRPMVIDGLLLMETRMALTRQSDGKLDAGGRAGGRAGERDKTK